MTVIDRIKSFNRSRIVVALLCVIGFAFFATIVRPEPAPAMVPVKIEAKVVEPPVIEAPVELTEFDKRQIQCLAENAYFEAGNQSIKGKIAVSNVVMNRVEDKRFPKTPCGVVYQRTKRVCQFSWVCEGKKRIRSQEQFADAKETAEQVYLGEIGDVTRGAKFYHADYVNPGWNLRRVIQIGDHIFYKG
jgi:spore germination cell wall hydrolase CwlJ-like protein